MFLYLLTLTFAISFVLVALLLFTSRDYHSFKENFINKSPKITALPIITPSGHIVTSVEDLDMQLEFLENQLQEKQNEINEKREKFESTGDNLKRLTEMTNEVKKYYVKLKTEISKGDMDCIELKNQIEKYKNRQAKLRDEVNENVKYYAGLLKGVDNGMSAEGYEIVKRNLMPGTVL